MSLSFCTKLHQQVGDRVRDKYWGWGTWPSLAAGPQIARVIFTVAVSQYFSGGAR
jgi:hypothetical protein